MYLPAIRTARPVQGYLLGPYTAVLYTDCQTQGQMIEYEHVLFVFRPGATSPFFAVAAERNRLMREVTPGYFLGVFPGTGHHNLGFSTDWGDVDKFAAEAVRIVVRYLSITDLPLRIPDWERQPQALWPN